MHRAHKTTFSALGTVHLQLSPHFSFLMLAFCDFAILRSLNTKLTLNIQEHFSGFYAPTNKKKMSRTRARFSNA